MKRRSLTSRPRAPALVHAAAIGTLAFAPTGCGDDGNGTSTSADSDQFPTAGPCAHDPDSPECGSTGLTPMTGTGGSTDATSVADTTTDTFPTAGPCAHDPDAPGCASSTGADSDSSGGSGSGSDSSGTGGSSSSSGG